MHNYKSTGSVGETWHNLRAENSFVLKTALISLDWTDNSAGTVLPMLCTISLSLESTHCLFSNLN